MERGLTEIYYYLILNSLLLSAHTFKAIKFKFVDKITVGIISMVEFCYTKFEIRISSFQGADHLISRGVTFVHPNFIYFTLGDKSNKCFSPIIKFVLTFCNYGPDSK